MRLTFISSIKCTLLDSDVGIIWSFAHMITGHPETSVLHTGGGENQKMGSRANLYIVGSYVFYYISFW